MRILLSIILSLSFLICTGEQVENLYQNVPKEINGWKTEEEDEVYNRENLYEYINGGAEIYLSYDFKRVFVRRYKSEEDDEIISEIYDMGTPEDAFGIFSIERQDKKIGIGQDSEYGGGMLRFWKSRYFVSIITLGNEKKSKPIMVKIAKEIEKNISSTGEKPNLIKIIPKTNLVEKSIKYFHTFPILNRQYYLAEENILNLNRNTDCLFAVFEEDYNVLLIKYPDTDKAKKAYHSFIEFYLPDADESGVAQIENGKWTAAEIFKKLLIIVLDAPRKDVAIRTIANIKLKGEK